MIITAWVLLIGFGAITLDLLYTQVFGQLTVKGVLLLMLSLSVSAVSAGVIWGNLL